MKHLYWKTLLLTDLQCIYLHENNIEIPFPYFFFISHKFWILIFLYCEYINNATEIESLRFKQRLEQRNGQSWFIRKPDVDKKD